jgi:hypothetical protein
MRRTSHATHASTAAVARIARATNKLETTVVSIAGREITVAIFGQHGELQDLVSAV